MTELHVGRSLDIETLEIAWLNDAELRLAGSLSTASALSEFGRQLDLLHGYVTAGKLPSFTVDVRRLNFVNSSVIRVFITWISRAERAAYKLVFLTDASITWHRLSFSVLKSLAPATVDVVDVVDGKRVAARRGGLG